MCAWKNTRQMLEDSDSNSSKACPHNVYNLVFCNLIGLQKNLAVGTKKWKYYVSKPPGCGCGLTHIASQYLLDDSFARFFASSSSALERDTIPNLCSTGIFKIGILFVVLAHRGWDKLYPWQWPLTRWLTKLIINAMNLEMMSFPGSVRNSFLHSR